MDERNWMDFKTLMSLGYELVHDEAFRVWTDLMTNTPKWYFWCETDPAQDGLMELCEDFINKHASFKLDGALVHSIIPIKSFFFASDDRSFFVRGSIWFNGAVWEELNGDDRKMFLAVDKVTYQAHKYSGHSIDTNNTILNMKDSWDAKNGNATKDNSPKNHTPTSK